MTEQDNQRQPQHALTDRSKENEDIAHLKALLSHTPEDNQSAGLGTRAIKDDHYIQFLINEYNSLTDFWKHADSRLESGINVYLTASALVVCILSIIAGREPAGVDHIH